VSEEGSSLIIDYTDHAFLGDVEADLCIIGAGAAGLSIARTFIETSINVCVVESGGLSGDVKGCKTPAPSSKQPSARKPSLGRRLTTLNRRRIASLKGAYDLLRSRVL
jgi:flavin-dependent dehydrogenase